MKKLAAILLASLLFSSGAMARDDFKICWSIYVGWMPWAYGAESGIVKKWADKYDITIDVVQINDYVESINQYTAGQFDACTMTNMDALTIPAAGGVDSTALIVGDFSNGNDAVILKGKESLADIKGQQVNLVELSVSHYLLARGLETVGLALPVGIECTDAAGAEPAGFPQMQQPVADNRRIDVLVCGAHLEGLPLNWQLTERGAVLKSRARTKPCYRMYALAGGPPFRPGLIMDEQNGAAIDVEIWSVPSAAFGSFVAGIPAPLGIGKVLVEDGSVVTGFICEPRGVEGATDITNLGGWKAYLASR